MPRPDSADMSPKGSITTVPSPAVSLKADCPYHSTCMSLSSNRRLTSRRQWLGDMVIATPAQCRGGRGHEAGEDREQERLVQPRAERSRDQMREERAAREDRLVVRAQGGEH